MGEAFIKICRKMLKWEWYNNVNTRILFFHCLLKANWEAGSWHGIDYKAGEFITSLPNLATGCGLSIQQTRTALNNLQSTGELTVKSFSQGRIISVNNWNKYQSVTDDATGNQQAINRQPNRQSTGNLTSVKEYKNIKNKELKNNKYMCAFETFWKCYPRKAEKQKAYKCYQTRLKEGYTEEQLQIACKNYAAKCEKDRTEEKYIKHGATFLGPDKPFEDYMKRENSNGRIETDVTADEEQRNRELDEAIRRLESGEADHDDDGMWD